MARYLLLEIPDNAVAEDLIKAVREKGGVIYRKPKPDESSEATFEPLPENVIVRALWMKPVKFCECNLVGDGEFVKGDKFGVYVHRKCAKPRPGHYQHPKNLIDPKYDLALPPGKISLGVQEPPTSDPAKYSNGRELPMVQLAVGEPTPKAEYDRVTKNLDSRS